MEFRRLGRSGLSVPALSFGTATFGGVGDFFKAWGSTGLDEARRMVGLCLDSGVTMFDSADGYSLGLAEEILGQALGGRRDSALISTKATFPFSDDPNACGSSRHHIMRQCEGSLRRLRTDRIDLYSMHGMDLRTPIDETLRALDDLVSSGKVRYIGCSNFSAWHLMKSLSLAERHGWNRYIAHQAYYSLVGRDLEWELIPLGLDQGVGTVVWSGLAGGALSGKVRRGQAAPSGSRVGQMAFVPYDQELLYRVVDVLDEIARERGKLVPQVALNWLLRKPTVASIVIGARTEEQLRQNLGAVGWSLSAAEVARLDAASETPPPYPYWHQRGFPQLVPPLAGMAQ